MGRTPIKKRIEKYYSIYAQQNISYSLFNMCLKSKDKKVCFYILITLNRRIVYIHEQLYVQYKLLSPSFLWERNSPTKIYSMCLQYWINIDLGVDHHSYRFSPSLTTSKPLQSLHMRCKIRIVRLKCSSFLYSRYSSI